MRESLLLLYSHPHVATNGAHLRTLNNIFLDGILAPEVKTLLTQEQSRPDGEPLAPGDAVDEALLGLSIRRYCLGNLA